jgi:toxin-antitoxin system PIN domain toxin
MKTSVIALLDVNVLIALSDPSHVFNDAVHRWFALHRSDGWATCALTENAFVRITSNPAYPGGRTTVGDATERLRDSCSDKRHSFWSESLSIREPARFQWHHVQGHRQLTDVYLLALAVSNGGRLATFDATISVRAVVGAGARHLEVIAA